MSFAHCSTERRRWRPRATTFCIAYGLSTTARWLWTVMKERDQLLRLRSSPNFMAKLTGIVMELNESRLRGDLTRITGRPIKKRREKAPEDWPQTIAVAESGARGRGADATALVKCSVPNVVRTERHLERWLGVIAVVDHGRETVAVGARESRVTSRLWSRHGRRMHGRPSPTTPRAIARLGTRRRQAMTMMSGDDVNVRLPARHTHRKWKRRPRRTARLAFDGNLTVRRAWTSHCYTGWPPSHSWSQSNRPSPIPWASIPCNSIPRRSAQRSPPSVRGGISDKPDDRRRLRDHMGGESRAEVRIIRPSARIGVKRPVHRTGGRADGGHWF